MGCFVTDEGTVEEPLLACIIGNTGAGKSTWASTVVSHCVDVAAYQLETLGFRAATSNKYVHKWMAKRGIYGLPDSMIHRVKTWNEFSKHIRDNYIKPAMSKGDRRVRVIIIDGITELGRMLDDKLGTMKMVEGPGGKLVPDKANMSQWMGKTNLIYQLLNDLTACGFHVIFTGQFQDNAKRLVAAKGGDDQVAKAKEARSTRTGIYPLIVGEGARRLFHDSMKWVFLVERVSSNDTVSIQVKTQPHDDFQLKCTEGLPNKVKDITLGQLMYDGGFLTEEDFEKAKEQQEVWRQEAEATKQGK